MTLNRRNMMTGLFLFPALSNAGKFLGTLQTEDSIPKALRLLTAARQQIGVTTLYDPAYVRLDYPNGDVPEDRGVCIDVIIRAYRSAFDFDFQKAIHKDMAINFSSYPSIWGLSRPDKNIDHRRVPNVATWLVREGHDLPLSGWKAGDLMTCHLPGNLPHILIVSEDAPKSAIMVKGIHNIGNGTREEKLLLTGLSAIRRFRFLPDRPSQTL